MTSREAAGTSVRLTPEVASRLAGLALSHVTREYPNKLDHVINGPEDVRPPRALHPLFYGSFDWHSCVHGYWLLAHVLRRFPALPEAPRIRELVDAQFTEENVRGEVAYLHEPSRGGFERPYGWAWLLKLSAELSRHATAEGERWHGALSPLTGEIAERFAAFLPRATYPNRTGFHYCSAFAVALALEHAEIEGKEAFAGALRAKARSFYEGDRDYQAWEPGGDDFLSPGLMEVECMRRVLPAPEFVAWLEGFFPRLREGEPARLFTPAIVSDRTDGKIRHLDGLNLSRAWCFRGLARALPEGDPRRAHAIRGANEHLEASLPHVGGDYAGEHWLATFALLALGEA